MPDDKAPPNAESYGYRVIGWCKEAIQESDDFLRGQDGYNKIDEAIRAIMGNNQELRSVALSGTTLNLTAKTFFDMVAGLTDVKPFWEYRTYNKRFEQHCGIYGKLSQHIWIERQMDMAFQYAVQYAIAGGSSYLEPYWDTRIQDMRAEAWDPRDILPIRPTSEPSIQYCYGVISRKARTVNDVKYLAKNVFNRPDLVKYIQPDRDSSIAGSLRNTRVGALLQRLGESPFRQRLFGDKAQKDIPRIPTTDLFTVYLDDDSVNETNNPVIMGNFDEKGTPENNYSYVVGPKERLYPRKRLIIYCNGIPEPFYDGPSPWWHGLFPYPKLSFDSVGWNYLGKAPIWDILPLNKTLDRHLRVYDDWLERLARPDIIGDKNAISEHMMNKMDSRRAGKKIRINPTAGKGVQIVGPDPLPQDFWIGIEHFTGWIKELAGVQDLSALMQLNQLPSDDTIEKLMESMSNTWRLRSRNIEVFMREYALMMAYNFAQFYNLPRRMTILGADGITSQDFDFDPGSLVPDFVDSADFGPDGEVKQEALARGPLHRLERAREFLRQFTFHVAPGSLLASSEWQRKMLYIQLSRAGLVDHWTLLDVLGIPNVGTPPPGINSITDRLVAEMNMGLGMQVNPAGRKASGQESPRLVMKES